MKVCVVGSGGREHALAAVLGRHHDVVITPGNPGIPGSVATPATEIDADLYVIGPEAPLVAGLADELRCEERRLGASFRISGTNCAFFGEFGARVPATAGSPPTRGTR